MSWVAAFPSQTPPKAARVGEAGLRKPSVSRTGRAS